MRDRVPLADNQRKGMQLTLSSLSGFFPTIIKSLGYTVSLLSIVRFLPLTCTQNADAQLYTVPPYAVGFVVMMLLNYSSDRVRARGPFIIGVFSVNLLGWVLLLAVVHNERVRYFACFCIVIGGYCIIPLIQSWVGESAVAMSLYVVS